MTGKELLTYIISICTDSGDFTIQNKSYFCTDLNVAKLNKTELICLLNDSEKNMHRIWIDNDHSLSTHSGLFEQIRINNKPCPEELNEFIKRDKKINDFLNSYE